MEKGAAINDKMKKLILPISRALVIIGLLLIGMSVAPNKYTPDALVVARACDGSIATGWENNLVIVERPEVTLEDFSKMKVKDFEKMVGQDLKFMEKMGFRGMRRYVKRAIKNGDMDANAPAPEVDEVKKGFWIGFALGSFLSILGFIAGIIWRRADPENPKTDKLVAGAGAGCLIVAVIVGAYALVAASLV